MVLFSFCLILSHPVIITDTQYSLICMLLVLAPSKSVSFLPPCPDCSWSCASNWPAPEGPLQENRGENPQDTEEGADQEDPGSWPRDTSPQHSQKERNKGSKGTQTTGGICTLTCSLNYYVCIDTRHYLWLWFWPLPSLLSYQLLVLSTGPLLLLCCQWFNFEVHHYFVTA